MSCIVYKPIGWTPLDCVRDIQRYDEYKTLKLAFCSRLDPLAQGLMYIMDGKDERLETFRHYNKTYEYSVILGIQTDSYDILGKPMISEYLEGAEDRMCELSETKVQRYPPYSSKTVWCDKKKRMVPLWLLAKNGELPLELPEHEVSIEYIQVLERYSISGLNLYGLIFDRISRIKPEYDFRQEYVLTQWRELLVLDQEYTCLKCRARVSSGTYIRCLADDVNGTAFDITRLSIGDLDLTQTQ